MLRTSRFVLNINYHQLSINYFIIFFVNVYSCAVRQIIIFHPYWVLPHPAFIRSFATVNKTQFSH